MMYAQLKQSSSSIRNTKIVSALLLSSALLLGVGCGGESSAASSCSVEETSSGQALITCTDGTTATIDGPSSEAQSCTIDEEGEEILIRCDDGSEVVINQGVDGTSGSSCSVEQNADGSATIICDDGTSADLNNPNGETPGAYGELGLELLAGVTSVGTSDGVGRETRMDGALDGAYDPSGEFLYFADSFNMTIRRFGLRTQQVVTLAGLAGQKGASDGVGLDARFEGPRGIAMHPGGDRVFIADGFNCTIRQLEIATNEVLTLTGQPGDCAAVDGSFEDARFRLTIGMVMESTGRYLYVADRGNNVIRRLDLQEDIVETIAGLLPPDSPADVRDHVDAAGADARLDGPGGIDLSEDETILYVNDTFNNVIRAISLVADEDDDDEEFMVSTIAGTAGEAGNVDGVGEDARFQISQGLARASDGLYVAGFHNSIRRIDLTTFEVTTVAGQNGQGGSADGPSFDARFGVSFGILAHPDGRRLYYMDRGNNNIRLYDRLTDEVTTAMGPSEPTGWRDGYPGISRMNSPRGIAANNEGTLVYLADRSNQAIRVFDIQNQELMTLAGLPGTSGFADGVADEARFWNPEGLWLNHDETHLYIADSWNDAIRRLDVTTGEVTTLVSGPDEFIDTPYALVGVEEDGALTLYISDGGTDTIRVLSLENDTVTTLAGGGVVDEDNPTDIDGVGEDAIFNNPTGLAITTDGSTLYVADAGYHVIRRVDIATGETTTIAGDIGVRDAFDGVANDATFSNPAHLALLGDEEVLLVSDRTNYAIRRVHLPTQEVTTIIGALGTSGGSGLLFTPIDETRLYFTSGLTTVGDDVIFTADQALLRVANILSEEEE